MEKNLFIATLIVASFESFIVLYMGLTWLLIHRKWGKRPIQMFRSFTKFYDTAIKSGFNEQFAEFYARTRFEKFLFISFFLRALLIFDILLYHYQWIELTNKWLLSFVFFIPWWVWYWEFQAIIGKRFWKYIKEFQFEFLLLVVAILFTIWFVCNMDFQAII